MLEIRIRAMCQLRPYDQPARRTRLLTDLQGCRDRIYLANRHG